MLLMIAGLVLFLGIHLVPTRPFFREKLVTRFGYNGYRALFSLVAGVGLVLIIAGYWMRPDRAPLFTPLPAARAAAPIIVTIVFVLFAAANMKTHIRRSIGHPMLLGLLLWSGVHLLANGDVTGTILFGAFFAYSVVALVSAMQRRTAKLIEPKWSHDAIAAVSGIALAALTMRFHPTLFGTPPVI